MSSPAASLSSDETRRLLAYLTAGCSSSVAFQMLSVAVGWQIYQLTHSAFDLGLVGLAQFLPMICLTLVVGHVADRFDRRRVAAVCMLIECGAAAGLTAGMWFGWLTRDWIYLLVLAGAAARAFESTTIAALLPALVDRTNLGRASAWSSSSTQTAQILGPALGGVTYALAPSAPFWLATVLFLLGAVLVFRLKLKRRAPSKAPVTLASLLGGIGFIRQNRLILGTLSLDLFAVLLGGATALLPIFSHDILHTGSWGLGMLRAAPALGAVVMSVFLAHRPLAGPIGKILFGSLITFGVATAAFALSHWLWVSLAALFVLGASDAVSVVVRLTLVQLRTPDEMLGRVSAVNKLFVGASNQLGEFESGVTASWFGAVPATVIGGLGTILVSLLWMRVFPELREIRSLDAGPESGLNEAAQVAKS
jgi:MFS family permease